MFQRFRPYLKYLLPVRTYFIGSVLCAGVYGFVYGFVLNIVLMKRVFPAIFSPERGLQFWQIVGLASLVPLVFFVRGVAAYFNAYFISLCGVRVLEQVRLDFFRKLQVLPLGFFARHPTGDLISRGLADTNQLQFTLTNVANEIFKQPATLVFAIGSLIYIASENRDVWLVLLCLASVPVAVFPIRYAGKHILRRAQQMQAQLGTVTDRFSENLGAAKEIRAFGLEERETSRFAAAVQSLFHVQMKIVKYSSFLSPTIEFISAVGVAATLVYAYYARIEWNTFLSIVFALFVSYEPVKKLGAINNDLKRGLSALDRLEEVLNEPEEIADPAEPIAVGRLHGDLAFAAVNFAYGQNGDIPALRSVTAHIPAGTVCALVGPSGAGKSTFANLVPRFYEVGAGSVTIDGLDVRAMRLADLRRNIALVSQDPVLFNDTVYNNLLLGRPGATRVEVVAAAVDAHADEFIAAFPAGYDTIVGERGARLSGGQKQRIALARAFLRGAPILILDEATSALDSQSEAAIQSALKKLLIGKTVIIIAHRFSTIRDASLILVFDQGRIVAEGNHASLYAGNPLYRSLYDRQHGAAEPAAV
ncbi:MAG TPA: ABC transporter ATP-binding protein [Opitutaceae bacterium]|jgi:subfamily B ATP-binding cassette protein MsbA|nr:ABC transporter ATP-binding protein [Opitutaceae bacterium]